MDASNPKATTVEEFMGGTAAWRTDLYSGATSGTLMTHQDSIALFKKLGVKMTPELKSTSVTMPFDGFGQAQYAQKMIDEYKAAGVPASQVFAQSFNKEDVLYWVKNEAAFGRQAVFLDGANSPADLPSLEALNGYKQAGIQIVAPPIFALLQAKDGQFAASTYAKNAKAAGLGHHCLEPGALRPLGQRQRRLVLPDREPGLQTRRRCDAGAGRAGQRRGHHGHLLRLARHRNLLRQLHGFVMKVGGAIILWK